MKPAEIVTAVVSIPVIAAFVVSALAGPTEAPAPVQIVAKAPETAPFIYLADEIVVEAKRAVANPSS